VPLLERELVVTTEEQYPQHIMIEFTQDKSDLLNNYKVGDVVKVSINLGGREWINPQGEAKYFNSVRVGELRKFRPKRQYNSNKRHQCQPRKRSSQPQLSQKKSTTICHSKRNHKNIKPDFESTRFPVFL
jgi:hypothetical protein